MTARVRLVAAWCVFLSSAVHAEVRYVDAAAAAGGDGTSWAAAFNDLQSALTAAAAGDELWVAGGTYTPSREVNRGDARSATFQLSSGVGLYGGFKGTETALDQRDPNSRATILSGDLNGDDRAAIAPLLLENEQTRTDNIYHVVTASGTDETAILDGLTISGGYANLVSGPNVSDLRQWAGGILNIGGSPTLEKCTVSDNYGRYVGGMYNRDGHPTVTDCTFSGNASIGECIPGTNAGLGSGGMLNNRSNPTLTACTFIGNEAGKGFCGQGGGMFNRNGSSPTLTNCIFVDNFANGGGGMSNSPDRRDGDSPTPTLINCTFIGNRNGAIFNWMITRGTFIGCTFTGHDRFTGLDRWAVTNFSSSPTFVDCAFVDNTSRGLVNFDESKPTLRNCVFARNRFEGDGAGLANFSRSHPTLIDCTFEDNEATGRGGAMYNGDWIRFNVGGQNNPTLTNCTFIGNSAGESGGGVFNTAGSSPLFIGCVLRGNAPGAVDAVDSSAPTLVNSVIVGNADGGVFAINASATLINCTVAGNSLGGVSAEEGSNLTLTNCILWGNVNGADRGESAQVFVDQTSTADVSFSSIQGRSAFVGNGNIGDDPRFVQNPDAGPDGRIGTDDDEYGDLRLRPGSPAIDAGDNAAVPDDLLTDFDGKSRLLDDRSTPDTGNGSLPIVDLGAFEFGAPPPTLTRIADGLGGIVGTVTVEETIRVRVASGFDDAEESLADGRIDRTSSDLELTDEGGRTPQLIGVRFVNVDIPPGAQIVGASIQFTVDERDARAVSLRIFGELTGDAAPIEGSSFDISSRALTGSSVEWNSIPPWNTLGKAGPDQATPDLTSIVQEIVNQRDWAAGNAMVFVITGNPGGERTAESWDGDRLAAPELSISYSATVIARIGVADTFISPLSEDCPLASFSLDATEPLILNGVTPTYTGDGTVPTATLVDDGGGRHTVQLDPPPTPGEWLQLDMRVTSKATGEIADLTVWVAHQPLDVNRDGRTDIQDATAFGDAFRGNREHRLIDLNCDGQVNVQDATAFGANWNGGWANRRLPPKP